jgi:4-hydroxyphenylpyruvate dioxygenase-like putative hemolysin
MKEKLAIMVDADEEGYLLQILQNQYKTDLLFFEIIQRMETKALVQVILKLCLSL